MQRYLKKNSSQNLMFSGSVETTLEANLEKMALGQGGALSDYTIGIEDDDVVSGWWEAQDESHRTYADKRRDEYPKIEECVHAILDDELEALQIKRQIVKDKYPKE